MNELAYELGLWVVQPHIMTMIGGYSIAFIGLLMINLVIFLVLDIHPKYGLWLFSGPIGPVVLMFIWMSAPFFRRRAKRLTEEMVARTLTESIERRRLHKLKQEATWERFKS